MKDMTGYTRYESYLSATRFSDGSLLLEGLLPLPLLTVRSSIHYIKQQTNIRIEECDNRCQQHALAISSFEDRHCRGERLQQLTSKP
jgi:hypothetical protein